MKAWRVETEDGETRYFATERIAEIYCQRWAASYAEGTGEDAAQTRKDIGPHPRMIEVEEQLSEEE